MHLAIFALGFWKTYAILCEILEELEGFDNYLCLPRVIIWTVTLGSTRSLLKIAYIDY
jgi:hypothetical protein